MKLTMTREHNDFDTGLQQAAERHGVFLRPWEEHQLAVRNAPPKPAPYVAPEGEPEPLLDLPTKRTIAVVGTVGTFVCAFAAIESPVIAAAIAPAFTFLGYAVAGIVGIPLAFTVVRWLLTAHKEETPPYGNDHTTQNIIVNVNVAGRDTKQGA